MARTAKKTAGNSGIATLLAKARNHLNSDLPIAILCYGQVLDKDPENPKALTALRNLTVVQRKHLIESCKSLLRVDAGPHALALSRIVSRVNPSDPQLAVFEARANIILKDQQAGLERIAPFAETHPDNEAVQITYGMALATTKNNAQAVDVLMPYYQAGSLDPEATNALGASLSYIGRLDEARIILLESARAGRLTINGIYNLSGQMDLSGEEAILDQLVEVFADETALPIFREMAAYALAKAHEHQKDFGTAFQFFLAANSLKSEEEILRFMTNIRQAKERATAAVEIIQSPSLSRCLAGPRPVFIVGLPRSGTTLQEQVLLRHSRVATLGETSQLAKVFDAMRYETPTEISPDAFRAAYMDAIPQSQRNAEVILDKMPQNAFIAGVALKAMPDARVIHCRRHPMACAFSAFRIRFAEGNSYAYRFDTIAEFYRLSEHIMEVWTSMFPDRIMPVYYEAFTESPATWIAKLVDFCGLDLEDGLTEYTGSNAPVHTASLAQVREKIYRGSSEQWKNYADQLMPLLAQMIDEIAIYEVSLEKQLAAQLTDQAQTRTATG